VRPIRLSDFSGGISEIFSSEDFAADSVAVAQGFVLESSVALRSQWPLQRLGSDTDWVAVRGFASGSDYLIGIKSNGTVWWAIAPAVGATSPTITWTQFTSLTSATNYRFIAEIPFQKSTQTVTELAAGEEGSVEVTLYGKNGLLIGGNPLTPAPSVVYESAPNTLSVFTYTKTYPSRVPHPSIPNLFIPDSGVMPRGTCGVLWGDRVVLGDIEWYASTGTDQALGSGTVARYKNAMWFSEPGQVDTFDPLNVVIPCSSDAQIVALAVIETGLLVFTTNATGRDGVILLRGTPTNFRVEVLRTGLCASPRTSAVHRNFAGQWADTGTVVFVDRLGGIWHTNGAAITRLDGSTITAYGPADDRDHVATVGPWLFASRGNRLLCFRAFGSSGSWTELALPSVTGDGRVDSLTAAGNAMYFVREGKLYRFAVGYTDGPRGLLDGTTALSLRIASPTLSIEQQGDAAHRRALWHRVGVRARGRGPASLQGVEVYAGPALAAGNATHSVTVAEAVGSRFEYVTQAGIGFSVEAAASFAFTGDVEVESMTFWVSGGEPSR
jgi:hypothetical protein